MYTRTRDAPSPGAEAKGTSPRAGRGVLRRIACTGRDTLHALSRPARRAARIARTRIFSLREGRHHEQYFPNPTLRECVGYRPSRTDISDHLSTLFFTALAQNARLIVELGTRGGESTRTLLAAASLLDAHVLSVDIENCSSLDLPHDEHWSFVEADDVSFGRSGFLEWCAAEGAAPEIDLLFIDTSHEYEHTVEELDVWLPHLAENGVAVFHDTNMREGVYVRMDGTVGHGWDNERGVIRAIEERLGASFDENRHFADVAGEFLVIHYPHCNGLTLLKRRMVE